MLNNSSKRLKAIIAGAGDLPLRVIDKLYELGDDFLVVSISGFGPTEYTQFEVGNIGEILAFLKEKGATDVIFCGAVKRPSLFSLKLDNVGKRWLKKLSFRAFLGDDALLKGIRSLLAEEGLNVVSPQEILKTLLTPSGLLTIQKPTDMDLKDIARGIFVLNAMSKADVGQAVIVQEGVVLAIEAAEGTAKLIERSAELKLKSEKGGVLVKTSKVGQDQSIDLPTIGPKTIMEAKNSNLSGIAIGADVSQIIDFEETVKLANENEIFIIGV